MHVLKRFIVGTPLERPARRIQNWMLGVPPITEWELRDARDNAYVRVLMRNTLKRDSGCVDVGAHSGFFLRQFLEFAPDGRHWAFEPIPALAERLRHQFPGVEVSGCALWDQEGQAPFYYVPEVPAWSGLRPRSYSKPTHPETIPVTLTRLDSVIPEDVAIAFVKIDVEGAELEVLRGSESLLKRCKPIIFFECAKAHHAYYATTSQAVHEFLAGCGMGVFLLDQTGPMTKEDFAAVYDGSLRSPHSIRDPPYDLKVWANYLAMPL